MTIIILKLTVQLLFGLGFWLSTPPVLAIRFLLDFLEVLIGPCLVARAYTPLPLP